MSDARANARRCAQRNHRWLFVVAQGDSTGRRWAYYCCRRCGTSDRRDFQRLMTHDVLFSEAEAA